ncbi:hypothetical protein [Streptomyces sp. NPDC102490]
MPLWADGDHVMPRHHARPHRTRTGRPVPPASSHAAPVRQQPGC